MPDSRTMDFIRYLQEEFDRHPKEWLNAHRKSTKVEKWEDEL